MADVKKPGLNGSGKAVMKMLTRLMMAAGVFRRSESGAVTVDWVVLTGAIVALVFSVIILLRPIVYEDAAGRISAKVTEVSTY